MWGTQRAQVSSGGVFHPVQHWNWGLKAQFTAVTALTSLIVSGLHSPEELTPVTSADGKWPAGDPFVGVLILDGDGTYCPCNLVPWEGFWVPHIPNLLWPLLGVSVSSVPEESTLCP